MSFIDKGFRGLRLGLLLALGSCGSEEQTKNISEPPQRDGSALEPIIATYSDLAPSLSADGTRVVFISGRESTETTLALKAFKSDWPEGGAPTAPVRVTGSDLGSETAAVIAPNGQWIALLVSAANGQTDLYLQDYAGAAAPVRLTNSAADKLSVHFSPDKGSTLLAWIERSEGASQAMLLEIGDGTGLDQADRKRAVSGDGEYVNELFFVPTADASFTLVTATSATDAPSQRLYSKRSFTAAADASAAPKTEWFKSPSQGSDVPPRSTASTAVFARKIVPYGSKSVIRSGDFEEEKPASSAVVSEAAFVSVESGAVSSFEDAPGYDLLSVDMFADSSAGFLTMRTAYHCQEPDGGLQYGAGIVIANADGSSFTRVLPRFVAATGAFEVVGDFCDVKRPDETVGRIDTRIESARLNQQATPTKYRAAYVSRFSTAFDPHCRLKMGDAEVYLLEVNGETKTIQPLSNNKAPLTDAAPAGNPCSL